MHWSVAGASIRGDSFCSVNDAPRFIPGIGTEDFFSSTSKLRFTAGVEPVGGLLLDRCIGTAFTGDSTSVRSMLSSFCDAEEEAAAGEAGFDSSSISTSSTAGCAADRTGAEAAAAGALAACPGGLAGLNAGGAIIPASFPRAAGVRTVTFAADERRRFVWDTRDACATASAKELILQYGGDDVGYSSCVCIDLAASATVEVHGGLSRLVRWSTVPSVLSPVNEHRKHEESAWNASY